MTRAPFRTGKLEHEVLIDGLMPGDAFRFDNLQGGWIYGHLIFKNASRVRVVLYDYQGPAFDHADDSLPKGQDRELNLPLGMGVERITASEEGGEMMGEPPRIDSVKAAGLVAKYNHQQRQWQKAVEAGDSNKAEVALNRVKALEQEAKSAGVTLPDWDPDRAQLPQDKVAINGIHKTEKPDPMMVVPSKQGRALTAEEKKEIADKQKALAKANVAKKAAANASSPAAKEAALSKTKAEPKPKVMQKTHDCLCGCGNETQSLYSPGHDARVKGILLKVERGELPYDVIPETVQPFCSFSGKWGTDEYTLTSAPVKVPNRPDITDTRQQALEALDV